MFYCGNVIVASVCGEEAQKNQSGKKPRKNYSFLLRLSNHLRFVWYLCGFIRRHENTFNRKFHAQIFLNLAYQMSECLPYLVFCLLRVL